jgi:hypothetical protein
MKQKQLTGYRANYPKKLMKCTAFAAAALLAMGGTGCTPLHTGGEPTPEPVPTDELVLDGEVGYDDSDLRLDGETSIDENELLLGGEPLPEPESEGRTRDDGPELMGKIAVIEETENP